MFNYTLSYTSFYFPQVYISEQVYSSPQLFFSHYLYMFTDTLIYVQPPSV